MSRNQGLRDLPGNVYYDMSIRAQYSAGHNDKARPLSFFEERGASLIEEANKYTLSIIRFQIDTQTLPTWVAEIEPGAAQTDPNLMIQNVNLSHDDGAGTITTIAPVPLTFTQEDFYSAVPGAPSTNPPHYVQEQEGWYYDKYSYASFVTILNTAYQTAMTNLIAAVPALAGVDAPTCYWNSSTDRLEIRARSDWFEESLGAKVNLYMSKSLYALFPNFDVEKSNYSVTLKRDYRVLFRSYSGKNIDSNFFGAFDAVAVTQEFSDLACIAPYNSLVFTSSSLPVVQNNMSAPYTFNDSQLVQIYGNTLNINPIITDIASQDYSLKSNLLYTPGSEYRRVSLTGSGRISKVDIQVWMLGKDGRMKPFYLHSNSSASLKLLFERIPE